MRWSSVRVALFTIPFWGLPGLQPATPTFYRDVLPIVQQHCQNCHRPGEIGRMPLLSYAQARPWAKAMRQQVMTRRMPPWFADAAHGEWANNPSLSAEQMATLSRWAESGAAAGEPKDAPPGRAWVPGWNIDPPDLVVAPAEAFAVPASGEVEYQFFILPTKLAEDRWVRMVEVRPTDRSVVHHAVLYVREAGSTWLRRHAPGKAFVPASDEPRVTTAEILGIYTPGQGPFRARPGMAKHLPAGADLVLQVHYTPAGRAVRDRCRVGVVFTEGPPGQQVLTLQLNQTRFRIPSGERRHRVSVSGTLPNDALLLSLFPHMHLRGVEFEYDLLGEGGQAETLLRVKPYDFYWQLRYELAEPRLLRKGTRLRATAWYDNSANNPRNPDPSVDVTYGEQSREEMMVGFFEVAVPHGTDKASFFLR